jgi:hypothetical protein
VAPAKGTLLACGFACWLAWPLAQVLELLDERVECKRYSQVGLLKMQSLVVCVCCVCFYVV